MCEANLDDATMLAFAERVAVSYAPQIDALYPAHYPAHLSITGRDGARHEMLCEIAPGDAEAPLNDDALRAKFVELASASLGVEEATHFAVDLAVPRGQVADVVARAFGGPR